MSFSADDYSMEYYRALAVVESNGLVFWSPPTKFRSTCPVSTLLNYLKSKDPSGARLLAEGPSGLLTSSFAPFGRSGRYVRPA